MQNFPPNYLKFLFSMNALHTQSVIQQRLVECPLDGPQHCGYTVIKPIKICTFCFLQGAYLLAGKTDDKQNTMAMKN